MSRIVKPFGRPVVRAMITMDHQGQIQVAAVRLGVAVPDVPLNALEACALLSNALAGTLQGICATVTTRKDVFDNGEIKQP